MLDIEGISLKHCGTFYRYSWTMLCALVILAACEKEPEETINSIVLSGGAYVQIANRQDLQLPPDSTTLSALNGGVFSLELRAAGEVLPDGLLKPPTLFMISNDLG
ncbi:MAG: hypothetical protein IIB43_09455 [Candidatus Marinimicrobia bacterium]|nr:hypothetical protein [Candidatus Neomarinimicrobiota bacterium]